MQLAVLGKVQVMKLETYVTRPVALLPQAFDGVDGTLATEGEARGSQLMVLIESQLIQVILRGAIAVDVVLTSVHRWQNKNNKKRY